MSSDDELSSNTSSSCDVESLQLAEEGEGSLYSIVQSAIESGRGRSGCDGRRRGRLRRYTLCDLRNKERVLNW